MDVPRGERLRMGAPQDAENKKGEAKTAPLAFVTLPKKRFTGGGDRNKGILPYSQRAL